MNLPGCMSGQCDRRQIWIFKIFTAKRCLLATISGAGFPLMNRMAALQPCPGGRQVSVIQCQVFEDFDNFFGVLCSRVGSSIDFFQRMGQLFCVLNDQGFAQCCCHTGIKCSVPLTVLIAESGR